MMKQPKMPQVPTNTVPPPPNAPTMADASVAAAGQRTRQSAIGGVGSTIATSPTGVMGSPNLASKSLLGQ